MPAYVNSRLLRSVDAYLHWCPGCNELHPLPDSWKFSGDTESPTFTPSFKHTFGMGKVCHYILNGGILSFCADCTHELAGRVVELPELPAYLREIGEIGIGEVMAMAKKKNGNEAQDSNVLHGRVSSQLVDGYDDVFIPVKGDDAPIGAKHDPFGQGRVQYEKVQVKSTKGDLIGAWKLIYVAPDTSVEVEAEEIGEVD